MPRTLSQRPSSTPPSTAATDTVADLLKKLGDIPPERVRLVPAPGTATEADVLRFLDHENRLFELVDGTLVEKAMGFEESALTTVLVVHLGGFVLANKLGIVVGADGVLKLTTGLVRIPDVSFISWGSLPGKKRPKQPIPQIPIDLAVEVLSKSNSKAEMKRKVAEYLGAGTRLVWLIDLRKQAAWVHAPGSDPVRLGDGDSLDGGNVLPGFALPLKTLFDQAESGPDA